MERTIAFDVIQCTTTFFNKNSFADSLFSIFRPTPPTLPIPMTSFLLSDHTCSVAPFPQHPFYPVLVSLLISYLHPLPPLTQCRQDNPGPTCEREHSHAVTRDESWHIWIWCFSQWQQIAQHSPTQLGSGESTCSEYPCLSEFWIKFLDQRSTSL